jgi:lactoylglutathione lyase
MDAARYGMILNTENHEDCVAFYRDVLGLPILFSRVEGKGAELTCFEIGGNYLMVETGGVAVPEGKSFSQGCFKLRINVDDLEKTKEHLEKCGVNYHFRQESWGTTIDTFDPDGNRIGIRDERTFRGQISGKLDAN